MDTYLLTVILLLGLAVFDLVVGVTNDAVNFMNSAVGSKAATRRTILIIAGLGIFTGVMFSGGMMEVARKGIFNPQFFVLSELLVIFMAVMLQDILLLDTYNTFGLPTSTTVSIVFGLFGSSLAVAAIKTLEAGNDFSMMFQAINSASVIKIISAIFLSILIAFLVGMLVQFITRSIFTFDFKKRFRRYGALWGGVALTAIVYFILLKGAKGSPFIPEEFIEWIKGHTGLVVLINFSFWAIVLQLIMWFTKVNILKVIVLIGTFSLAMAFAANDLVNFIGAPVAGLEAYKIATEAGSFDISMGGLAKKIPADQLVLILSGLVMIAALFLSKKAKTVTKTEVSLGRQDEGFERFESYAFARMIVRAFINLNKYYKRIVPKSFRKKLEARFNIKEFQPVTDEKGDKQAFDLVRASVNLMVAAALIALATSMKLPLSTTYVTFIVAMAAALPDRAWGRDSAVYRISGVLTVVGGWFFTAISASIVAAIIATILYYGGLTATIGMLALVAFIIFRSAKLHKRRDKEQEEEENNSKLQLDTPEKAIEHVFTNVSDYVGSINKALSLSIEGLCNNDLTKARKAKKRAKKLDKQANALVADVLKVMRFANEKDLENGHMFAKPLGALHELTERLRSMTTDNFKYIDNNHQPMLEEQVLELKSLDAAYTALFNSINKCLKLKSDNAGLLESEDGPKAAEQNFKAVIKKNNKNQIKRIQESQSNKRRSILYLNILEDTNSVVDNILFIVNSYDKFRDIYKQQ